MPSSRPFRLPRSGVWVYQPRTGVVVIDAPLRTLLGLPRAVAELPLSQVLTRLHPEDRERARLALTGATNAVVPIRALALGADRPLLARAADLADASEALPCVGLMIVDEAHAVANRTARTPQTRARRILLVDDEARVRTALARGLRQLGHRVTEAASGAEATTALEAMEEAPDLLITDVDMPGETGPQLARRVRTRWRMPVLFLSGKVEGVDILPGEGPLLDKPVRLGPLQEAIEALVSVARIDASGPTG